MRCLNCFKEFEEGDYCPHCGTNNKEFKNKPNCLQPGSLFIMKDILLVRH